MNIIIIIFILILIIEIFLFEILVILENRHPDKVKTWSSVLAILPILGIIIYLIFGYRLEQSLFRHKQLNKNKVKQKVRKQQNRLEEGYVVMGEDMDRNKKLVRLSLENSLAPLSINNQVRVLTNGTDKFRALFEAIKNAKKYIHLEYYIFKDDKIGREVRDLLISKALEGLEIKIIVDGIGSHSLSKEFIRPLKNANIKVKWFLPVHFPYLTKKLNYRNHRKIVVIDGCIGFLGGLNIGDEYLSRDRKLGFWRDTHLMVEGDSVHILQTTFLDDWFFVTGERIEGAKYYPTPKQVGKQLTQIIAGGPDTEWEPIHQLFFTALANAEQRIWIETPYFVPDDSMMMALKTASLSGVDVRVIVQGIPDHKITYWATQSYIEDLFKAGIKVYRYNKGILHSKVIIIDQGIGIVGSANFDIRSFKLDFEISAICYNKEFVFRLEQDFEEDFRNSTFEDVPTFMNRGLSVRIKEANARLLSPLL
ncbi:MAG: cardiolipin synthase [Desulfitobacteriaceae bacterium]